MQKLRRFGLKNPRSLTLKDPKIYRYLNQLDSCIVGLKERQWFLYSGYSKHMIENESKFALLTKQNGGYVTFGDNAKGKIIGQENIGKATSSLIENVIVVDDLKYYLLSIVNFVTKVLK